MTPDTLGDKCKLFEQIEAGRRSMPLLPVMARLDGKSFHSWTKGLARPFDEGLSRLMIETAKFLVEETHARIGYVQSDEISLVFYADPTNLRSMLLFDGKYQKLVSVLASMATAHFNALISKYVPSKTGKLAFFDCRVWQVPNLQEAANTILWRELDCAKNATSMAARSVYSHNELNEKVTSEMQEMLFQKGIRFSDYPAFFRRGTFVARKTVEVELTAEERARIPEEYRPAEGTKFPRSQVLELDMPPFSKVQNRIGVIFENQDPVEKPILSQEKL